MQPLPPRTPLPTFPHPLEKQLSTIFPEEIMPLAVYLFGQHPCNETFLNTMEIDQFPFLNGDWQWCRPATSKPGYYGRFRSPTINFENREKGATYRYQLCMDENKLVVKKFEEHESEKFEEHEFEEFEEHESVKPIAQCGFEGMTIDALGALVKRAQEIEINRLIRGTQSEDITIRDQVIKAWKGDSEAQCQLGLLYKKGTGFKPAYQNQLAYYWFDKSSGMENTEANFQLSLMHYMGIACKKECGIAHKHLRVADDRQHLLASCYEYLLLLINHLKSLKEDGFISQLTFKERCFQFNGPDPKKANHRISNMNHRYKLLMKLSEDCLQACFITTYIDWKQKAINENEFLFNMRAMATQGYAPAQYVLGKRGEGNGLSLAAQQGYPLALAEQLAVSVFIRSQATANVKTLLSNLPAEHLEQVISYAPREVYTYEEIFKEFNQFEEEKVHELEEVFREAFKLVNADHGFKLN